MGAAARKKARRRKERRELPRLMAKVMGPILLERFRPNCCVNGTRIAIEVLARFNISAKPMATRTATFNAPAWVHTLNQLRGTSEPIPEGDAYMGDAGSGDATGPGWDGHLVCVAGDYLIDAAMGQFHRPERGICIPSQSMAHKQPRERLAGFLAGSETIIVEERQHGAAVVYEPHLDDDGFRAFSGWMLHEGNREAIDLVYAAVKGLTIV